VDRPFITVFDVIARSVRNLPVGIRELSRPYHSASMIVCRDGDEAVVINGLTGEEAFASPDHGRAIQAAIDGIARGDVVVLAGDYDLGDGIRLIGPDKGLICEDGVVFKYDGPGAAITIDAEIRLRLWKLESPGGEGAYGIRDIGIGTSYVDVYQIYNFAEAAVWFDAASATVNRANSYWNIRWIHCNARTKYGVLLESAEGVYHEGDRWDIGVMLYPTKRGLQVGSDPAHDTIKYHVFNVDIDSAGHTELLVEVVNPRNVINVEGYTPATSGCDILVGEAATETRINRHAHAGIRLKLLNLETYVDWDAVNELYRYAYAFDSLDGLCVDTSGSGSVTLNAALPNHAVLSTGATEGSWACVNKAIGYPEPILTFDKWQGFKTRVRLESNANQKAWIMVGDREANNHYGFYIENDKVYGSVGDGSSETLTGPLATFGAPAELRLCALLQGDEATFFIDGSLAGRLASGLPSGGDRADRVLAIHLTNTAAEDKVLRVGGWEYFIKRG